MTFDLIQRSSFVLEAMGINFSYSFKEEAFYIQEPSVSDDIELDELRALGVRFISTGAVKDSGAKLYCAYKSII